MYSDGDSEDESEGEMEITEEDRKFIADDDSEDELVRRKKKKRKMSEAEEDLDDDDIDLIVDNLGLRKEQTFKKLRKKVDEPMRVETLENMFQEDETPPGEPMEQDEEMATSPRSPAKRVEPAHYSQDEDDLENFIASEDEDEMDEALREERRRARKAERKKIPLVEEAGISEDVWRDIQDIFGDGSDYDWAIQLQLSLKLGENIEESRDMEEDDLPKKQLRLTDVYEPAALKEKMLTAEDEQIRITDIPERFQLHNVGTGTPTETELQREIIYISRMMIEELKDSKTEHPDFPKVIQQVLKFIRTDHLEVPFIYAHRKDYLQGLVDRNSLWRIFELHLQFESIQARIHKINQLYQDICAGNEQTPGIGGDETIEKWLNSLSIMSPDKLNDVHQYIQMKYGTIVSALDHAKRNTFKRQKKRTQYEEAVNANLNNFAEVCLHFFALN